MLQKFFTDTIMGRFIKNLLATTPISKLPFISIGDTMVSGCFYVYDGYITKCESTGPFWLNSSDVLYPSDTLYPSDYTYPGLGVEPARFKVIRRYDEDDISNTYTYHSKFNYYDSETHKYLGEYLRMIRGKYGIDLMPYYNCFNYEVIQDVYLKKVSGTEIEVKYGENNDVKVYAIPIHFFKKYTIALDCPNEVLVRAVIYSSSGTIRKFDNHPDLVANSISYENLKFNSPQGFMITTSSSVLCSQQKNLYLLVQVPANNNSSIVVLEGNYEKSYPTIIPGNIKEGNIVSTGNTLEYEYFWEPISYGDEFDIQPKLLMMNTEQSYAFSDRLIEYLLLNVIDHTDVSTTNIKNVQKMLYYFDEEFRNYATMKDKLYGVWDEETSKAVKRLVVKFREKYPLLDMNDGVNKDLEQIFVMEGGNYL